ncbi:Serine carboxypeptidase 3 [Maublancomyces gigas]|uniref:Serine carboxypeptidase 3 n=1 Tax=Discina gigas TaxID=1032678 RepID=A0ABR3GIP6_9PEZI
MSHYSGAHPNNPATDQGKSISVRGWSVTTHKLPILKSGEIDTMTKKLGIAPPEMIFGNNSVDVKHESGWGIHFSALDALSLVDKTGESMLRVSYSESWQKMRERIHENIKEVVKPFDWTYTTSYKGTISSTQEFTPTASRFTRTDDLIPFDRLKQPEPILLFDEVVLYEDELADNGISILTVKIRVMPERLFILCRFFLRLDGVLFRVRDTRVYVDFSSGEVIREYQAREETYNHVRSGMYGRALEEIPSLMRDAQYVSELTPVVETEREKKTIRAFTKLTTVPPRPSIASRSFHASLLRPTQTPTPNPASEDPPPKPSGVIERLADKLREIMPNTADQYAAYAISQELYNECVGQAAYVEGVELSESAKFWYEVCKRDPTFSAWAQVTVLHMWMLIVRIRAFEPERVQSWQQHFIDHFFYDSEEKMINTFKLTSGQQRKKYLKALYEQYRGTTASFDEGLCKGDAVLAAAVWRNLFDSNPDVDIQLLAIITSYIRRVLSGLNKVSDETIYNGRIRFGNPLDEKPGVLRASRFLEELTAQEKNSKETNEGVGEILV